MRSGWEKKKKKIERNLSCFVAEIEKRAWEKVRSPRAKKGGIFEQRLALAGVENGLRFAPYQNEIGMTKEIQGSRFHFRKEIYRGRKFEKRYGNQARGDSRKPFDFLNSFYHHQLLKDGPLSSFNAWNGSFNANAISMSNSNAMELLH